jgi:hypothetical protein
MPANSKIARKPAAAKPLSSRDKVRAHRKRLRAQGMRPITLWVPDIRTKEFAERARRAPLAIAHSSHEAEDQAWVDAVSWWNSPEHVALEERELPAPWWRTD